MVDGLWFTKCMTNSTTTTNRNKLFRNLLDAERAVTEAQQVRMALEALVAAGNFRAQSLAEQARRDVQEFDAEVMYAMDAVCDAGYTPEDYKQWLAQ